MNHKKLLKLIEDKKEEKPKYTVRFEKELLKSVRLSKNDLNPWYKSQKEHWIGWLEEYDGDGYYGRKDNNRDAKFIFNHINCPPMLLWLCEISGVEEKYLKQAIKNAHETSGSYPSQCSAIRKVISWEMVEEKLKN